MKGLLILSAVGFVFLIAFAIWYPSTHESKAERIEKLEHQVGDLRQRVAELERK